MHKVALRTMTQTITKNDVTYYRCEECGLWYRDQATAAKCQAWCAEHKSCNLEIIKHAVGGADGPLRSKPH